MDPLAKLKPLDSFQQRHHTLSFPLAVVKKYSDDGGGQLAALIAYYGFFSLFPLLLVFVTVLGFVLQNNQAAQDKAVETALGQFPVIGTQLEVGSLAGNGLALGVGLLVLLWSGLRVTVSIQNAFNHVWAVPRRERPDYLFTRLRGLALLTVLGVLSVVALVASIAFGGGFDVPGLTGTVQLAISLTINLLLFAIVFRILTAPSVSTRELWPGFIVAALLYTALQVFGGLYLGRVVSGATDVYGVFALVIGLFAWIYVCAVAVIYSAEVNVVRLRRLWPRSMFEPTLPADHAALTALALTEQRADTQSIEVKFDRPEPGDTIKDGHDPPA